MSFNELLSITGLLLELLVLGEAGLMKDVSMLRFASPDTVTPDQTCTLIDFQSLSSMTTFPRRSRSWTT